MSEIPQDIRERAMHLFAAADGVETVPEAVEIIARGLMNEIERCAKIAETVPLDTYATPGHMEQRDRHRATIAAAIRRGAP